MLIHFLFNPQIDVNNMNSDALGAAYHSEDGSHMISLCVRASISWKKQEIIVREYNFEVKYSSKIGVSWVSGNICANDDPSCNNFPKIQFSFKGDYSLIVGNKKELFLQECTLLLQVSG